MSICNHNHEEIVYSSSACPLCDMTQQAKDSGDMIDRISLMHERLRQYHNKLVDRAKKYAPELLI